MPVAIILAVVISTVLYFFITVISINSIPIAELQNSTAPLTLVFSKITSSPVWIITVIALTASAGGVLAHIISGSRLLYGMAEAGWLHKRLAIVHESRKTPSLAIAIVVVLSAILAFFIDLTTLATITSFMILAVFLLVNVALAFLKLRKVKSAQSRISVPIIIPILGMLSCLTLLTLQIIHLL
jgi:amino acid transporter